MKRVLPRFKGFTEGAVFLLGVSLRRPQVLASQAGREQKERAQGYLTKYPEAKP